MNEYQECLQDIMNSSQTDEEKLKQLKELEKVKPMRLAYYLDEAVLVRGQKGGVSAAYNVLNSKYLDYYAYEGVCNTLQFLGTLDTSHGDEVMCRYRNYVTAQLQGNASAVH